MLDGCILPVSRSDHYFRIILNVNRYGGQLKSDELRKASQLTTKDTKDTSKTMKSFKFLNEFACVRSQDLLRTRQPAPLQRADARRQEAIHLLRPIERSVAEAAAEVPVGAEEDPDGLLPGEHEDDPGATPAGERGAAAGGHPGVARGQQALEARAGQAQGHREPEWVIQHSQMNSPPHHTEKFYSMIVLIP